MNRQCIAGEQGFILVWALLLMIVVTLLGVSGIATSIFETKMAANEAIHKQTFYQADGGTEIGISLLQHNMNCTDAGFTKTLDGKIAIKSGSERFWFSNNKTDGISMASDTNRDLYYPSDYADSDPDAPHTNIRINGVVKLMAGASLQQLAGYEGLGKAIGADGAFLIYEFAVERIGERNSRTAIRTFYRADNQFASYPAGNCIY